MVLYSFQLALLLIAIGVEASRTRTSNRGGKSLVNTFPFNQRGATDSARAAQGHDDHHAHHGDHEEEGDGEDREARQRNRRPDFGNFGDRDNRQRGRDDIDLNIGNIAAAGERCIDKVVMVEETEYDDHIECKHSYTNRCHTTYTTDFEPQQQEECDENFRKNCFIEYKKVAVNEKVRKCTTPLEYVESGTGCKKVTQSTCTTRFHEHDVEDDVVNCRDVQDEKCEDVTQGYTTEQKCTYWPRRECDTRSERVTKYTPETECKPVVLELCGPELEAVTGDEQCFDESATVVQEVRFRKDLFQITCTEIETILARYLRRLATSSHNASASMLPSLCPSSSPLKSVLTSQKRCAPGPGGTPGRSRSPL